MVTQNEGCNFLLQIRIWIKNSIVLFFLITARSHFSCIACYLIYLPVCSSDGFCFFSLRSFLKLACASRAQGNNLCTRPVILKIKSSQLRITYLDNCYNCVARNNLQFFLIYLIGYSFVLFLVCLFLQLLHVISLKDKLQNVLLRCVI